MRTSVYIRCRALYIAFTIRRFNTEQAPPLRMDTGSSFFDVVRAPLYVSIFAASLLWMLAVPPAVAQESTAFEVHAVSDLVRVFQDGYPQRARQSAIEVFGIRGEVLSAQIVVDAADDLDQVHARFGDIRHVGSRYQVSSEVLEWNFVGSIPLDENTPNQRKGALVRQAPAEFPDYLSAEETRSVAAGKQQAIWLTIRIPDDAPAGRYRGSVSVEADGESGQVPIHLRVYGFTLPEERHLTITEWFDLHDVTRFEMVDSLYSENYFEMLRTYARNMRRHRQNAFRLHMEPYIEITRTEAGEYAFDFSLFDRIAEVFWQVGDMDVLETGFVGAFGEGDWSSRNIHLKSYEVVDEATGEMETVPGKEVLPALLPAFYEHLKEKGWAEKTVFHVKDEPTAHNVVDYRELSAYVHELVPEFTRMDAVETAYLDDRIEIAVPKLGHLGAWFEEYKDLQRDGVELWYYTVGIYQASSYPNRTIDLPLIQSRLFHWLNYRFGITGFLHWGWNQWTDNPFKETGQHIGDGWLVYPGDNQLLNSVRWEQMRNGLQDYEYFWLLEDRVRTLKDSLGPRFSWIDPEHQGQRLAKKVVADFTRYTSEPSTLYQTKREIIGQLQALQKTPRSYVQIHAPEGARSTNSSRVEVFGCVEEGSTVTINGESVPVEGGNLLADDEIVSPDENIIRVAIEKDGARRIIRRDIDVGY